MIPTDKPSKEILHDWGTNPNYWKLGILYFNKNDKRIFPPKKFKQFGWTVNFANPISIIAFIALIAIIILISKSLRTI